MPKRRRRRKTRSSDVFLYFVCAAIAVAVALPVIARTVSANAELIVAVLASVAVGLAVGGVVMVRRRRKARAVQEVRLREIFRYHEMSALQFEEALKALCERDGCRNVRRVGGAGDLGADVIATTPDGRKVVLQAKRYNIKRYVGGPDLQKFGGTCYVVHEADVAAVVTTAASFSKQARSYATHTNIRLLDNADLAAWASKTGPAPWA